MSKSYIFDWGELRLRLTEKQATRDATIREAFDQWVEGHSGFDEASQSEMEEFFNLFRASWIICEGYCS
jgi:hypothetical protein